MPDNSSPSSRPRASRENTLIGRSSSPPPPLSTHRNPAGGGQDAGGQHEPEQRERQKHFPAQPHQLVVTEARKGRTHPENAETDEGYLEGQPNRARDPGERRHPERRQPAAQEQDRGHRAD